MVTGEDADSRPSALQYDFQVYSSSGTLLADSGLISAADWTVPSGKLSWGQSYYWVVQDFDGAAYSAAPDPSYLATPVPQPLVTSGLSQNESGPGFNASSGNYTTSATDLKVPVAGPALSIERDYNSADPRVAGAFGAGWSSVLDMTVGPGQVNSAGTTATEVVTYPDGQQVAFGLNANGTYTPPQGRFSTFTPVTGGGFTLTDKNDTKYTFTQSLGGGTWGITSLTDALGHALNFSYSGTPSEVTTITSAATGRHIHLIWTSRLARRTTMSTTCGAIPSAGRIPT
jgi:hypothetical protein